MNIAHAFCNNIYTAKGRTGVVAAAVTMGGLRAALWSAIIPAAHTMPRQTGEWNLGHDAKCNEFRLKEIFCLQPTCIIFWRWAINLVCIQGRRKHDFFASKRKILAQEGIFCGNLCTVTKLNYNFSLAKISCSQSCSLARCELIFLW